MSRWMVCLRLPHFAAESVRHGRPPETPILVIGRKKVLATCAHAVQYGVRMGMTPRQAAYLCPNAYSRSVDDPAIQESAGRVLSALSEFSDYVEVDGLPTAKPPKRAVHGSDAHQAAVFFVDIGRLTPEAAYDLARKMSSAAALATGLPVFTGLAPAKFTAYAAAVTTAANTVQHIVSEASTAQFLAPLPVTLLPLEPRLAERLTTLGLTTLGALAALEPGAVFAQFGKPGLTLYQMARGWDPRRVARYPRVKPLRATCQFEDSIAGRTELEASLRGVVARLVRRLHARGYMLQSLGLVLHLENGQSLAKRLTLREPISEAARILAALQRMLGDLKLPARVACYDLSLEDFVPFSAQQLPLFPDEETPARALDEALAALSARPNAPACWRFVVAHPTARRIERRYRFEVA